MGLFDNLFLDANTAVTINDGVDHSKDVVQPIIEPLPISQGWDNEASWIQDAAKDTKIDDSLDTLFDADNADEKASEKILAPEPPKDIALEIGLGPATITPDAIETATESFDIWGDISFDIWGDMGLSNDAPGDTSAPPPDTSVISEVEMEHIDDTITNENISWVDVLPDMTDVALISNIEPLIEVSTPETTLPENNIESTDATTLWNTGSENALFSLLNSDAVEWWDVIPENSELSPSIDEGVSNDSLFGMMENAPDPVAPGLTTVENNMIHETSPLEWVSYSPISHTPAPWVQVPKLKAKLSEFLSELETMEVGDETAKTHKFEQIEMCRQRISEIQIEYDARINALKTEMQALEREIAEMDSEKNHIKNVIQTFQKELEIV